MSSTETTFTGKIVKLVFDQGFGFIEPIPKKDRDVFFHATGMRERDKFSCLSAGQQVQFTLRQIDDGRPPRAVDVVALDE